MKIDNKGNGWVEISCGTPGNALHRKGTDTYVVNGVAMIPEKDVALWEEVTPPQVMPEEYRTRVAALVRGRYTGSQEFSIQRGAINALLAACAGTLDDEKTAEADSALEEYAEYNDFVERCKERARIPETIQ